ncbi:hypothetical protein KSP39_PZI017108 [Platanthera zijinensis]|uniref:Myb/SANT-like domain-containing protein n=1 Tax=Platanthera zijinensis TaxID=2320716 RepID=A0AAP0B4Q8_9ASPA
MELKRGETGLGWNASRKTIDASDEWWDERLKVVPAAKKFRYSGIHPELEEKLNMMFSSVVATGRHACTPNTINEIPESVDETGISDVDPEDIDVIGDPAPRENTATSAHGKKRKKGKSKVISSVLEDLAESSKTISRCIQEAPQKAISEFSIRRAIDKLATYPEVQADEDFLDFAITYFMDRNHRETFLCLPDGMNVKWLRNRFLRGG